VSHIPVLPFARSERGRVVAGVCGGIAERLEVDPTLVRLIFALLSLAGGAGILLYLALWVWTNGKRPLIGIALVGLATMTMLVALGFPSAVFLGAALVATGAFILARRRGRIPGIALLMGGAIVMLSHIGTSQSFVAPGALLGTFVLVVGPWAWRLTEERSERIRLAERADIAARIHDSVLQTLALVQRDADDPPRVRAIARRQERELRRWLYGSGYGSARTFADALLEAVADVEEAHAIRVDVATAGDAPLDDALAQLVLATREAMTNAANHSRTDEISLYAEVESGTVSVFVRDRGAGFDRATVAPDRRGIAESIEARMHRAGGSATITSSPGNGTEVELTMPRATS
jgi:signal transduction histidine kinase